MKLTLFSILTITTTMILCISAAPIQLEERGSFGCLYEPTPEEFNPPSPPSAPALGTKSPYC